MGSKRKRNTSDELIAIPWKVNFTFLTKYARNNGTHTAINIPALPPRQEQVKSCSGFFDNRKQYLLRRQINEIQEQ